MDCIKVSVIVPIYNVKAYLKECLDSLERQTLKDIEVIMINDGSTDGSDLIAAEYSHRNSNYRLINQDNCGLSSARNIGIDLAQGKYIYFLDSDDYLIDTALETLYTAAENGRLDQVRFAAYTFEDGTEDYRWSRGVDDTGFLYLGSYPDVYSGSEFYQMAIDNDDYYPSCTMIFTKREIIEKNKLRFYGGIIHEDELYNLQLTYYCERVSVINRPLYFRRLRANSIVSGSDYISKIKSLIVIAEEADMFIDSHPGISKKTANWLNWYYALYMLEYWERLPKEEQSSPELNDCFSKLEPLLKKNDNLHISVRLFYTNKHLYSLYKGLRRITRAGNKKLDKSIKRLVSAKKDPHIVFWVFTPTHGNIGDQAIAVSEQRMLDSLRVRYFEVNGDLLSELYRKGMLDVFNGNPILFHGGGYLGTLWFNNEDLVREIITDNPDSSILFLPNTLYFDDNETGRTERERSAEIYRSHSDLKIYAREQKSYLTLVEMGVNSDVVPDMAMMLKEDGSDVERSGCMLLLRNDREKTRSADIDEGIKTALKLLFDGNIVNGDTVLPYEIPAHRREYELSVFLNRVRGFELIVTDRLHGMISAAITGTPCIVIGSRSHKLKECYKWIANLDYICFCDSPSMIPELYAKMPHGTQIYDNSKLLEMFAGLKEDITRLAK